MKPTASYEEHGSWYFSEHERFAVRCVETHAGAFWECIECASGRVLFRRETTTLAFVGWEGEERVWCAAEQEGVFALRCYVLPAGEEERSIVVAVGEKNRSMVQVLFDRTGEQCAVLTMEALLLFSLREGTLRWRDASLHVYGPELLWPAASTNGSVLYNEEQHPNYVRLGAFHPDGQQFFVYTSGSNVAALIGSTTGERRCFLLEAPPVPYANEAIARERTPTLQVTWTGDALCCGPVKGSEPTLQWVREDGSSQQRCSVFSSSVVWESSSVHWSAEARWALVTAPGDGVRASLRASVCSVLEPASEAIDAEMVGRLVSVCWLDDERVLGLSKIERKASKGKKRTEQTLFSVYFRQAKCWSNAQVLFLDAEGVEASPRCKYLVLRNKKTEWLVDGEEVRAMFPLRRASVPLPSGWIVPWSGVPRSAFTCFSSDEKRVALHFEKANEGRRKTNFTLHSVGASGMIGGGEDGLYWIESGASSTFWMLSKSNSVTPRLLEMSFETGKKLRSLDHVFEGVTSIEACAWNVAQARLAVCVKTAEQRFIWLLDLQDGVRLWSKKLPGTKAVTLSFSPDGSALACHSGKKLRVYERSGALRWRVQLDRVRKRTELFWGTASLVLLHRWFERERVTAVVIDPNDGRVRNTTKFSLWMDSNAPLLSPDRKWLLLQASKNSIASFTEQRGARERDQCALLELDTGELRWVQGKFGWLSCDAEEVFHWRILGWHFWDEQSLLVLLDAIETQNVSLARVSLEERVLEYCALRRFSEDFLADPTFVWSPEKQWLGVLTKTDAYWLRREQLFVR